MEPLSLFDCNVSFGSRQFRHPGSFTKKRRCCEKMEEFGIQKALVWHSLSKEYDPAEGNRILYREIAGEPRLLPVPALLPHYTGNSRRRISWRRNCARITSVRSLCFRPPTAFPCRRSTAACFSIC